MRNFLLAFDLASKRQDQRASGVKGMHRRYVELWVEWVASICFLNSRLFTDSSGFLLTAGIFQLAISWRRELLLPTLPCSKSSYSGTARVPQEDVFNQMEEPRWLLRWHARRGFSVASRQLLGTELLQRTVQRYTGLVYSKLRKLMMPAGAYLSIVDQIGSNGHLGYLTAILMAIWMSKFM